MKIYTIEEIEANRKAHVAALRSGKYKQTMDALRKEDGFCCLGVACDVVDPTGWHLAAEEDYRFDGEPGLLPPRVQRALGIKNSSPALICEDNDEELDAEEHFYEQEAAECNDIAGYDFIELADMFEVYYASHPPIPDTGERK